MLHIHLNKPQNAFHLRDDILHINLALKHSKSSQYYSCEHSLLHIDEQNVQPLSEYKLNQDYGI